MPPSRTILQIVAGACVVAGAVWLYFDDPSPPPPKLVGETAKSRAARLARRASEPRPAVPAEAVGEAPPSADAITPTTVAGSPAESPEVPSETPAPEASSLSAGTAQSPLPLLRDETLVEEVIDGNLAIPAKILRYAQRLVAQYDSNADGKLEENEWANMRGNPRLADRDRNGEISIDELAARITAHGLRRSMRLMPVRIAGGAGRGLAEPTPEGVLAEAGPLPGQADTLADAESRAAEARRRRRFHVPTEQLPEGLADWFVDNDVDGDGQITMTEFSANLTDAEVERFNNYDLNADGLITPQEFIGSELTRRAAEEAEKQQQLAAQQAADAAEAAQQEAAPPESPRSR